MNLTPKQQLLKRVNQLNIEHPRYKEFHDMLDSLRPDRSLGEYDYTPQHLFILGESGVGKSRMVKNYAKANPHYTDIDEEGTEIDVKRVVYTELPDPFTILEFYQTIVRALGAPQFAGVRVGDVKRQAFTLLEELRVEMLILDETNYILGSRFVRKTEAMEAIKHVSNQGNVSVVLVGTPDTRELTKMHFQYFRRFPTVELHRFSTCDDMFCKLLTTIEEQIAPPEPIGLGNRGTGLPQVFHAMSGGLLGALAPILQTTYRKMLHSFEMDDLGDAEKFIAMLEVAQRTILGDNEVAFMKMLEKSEGNNSPDKDDDGLVVAQI